MARVYWPHRGPGGHCLPTHTIWWRQDDPVLRRYPQRQAFSQCCIDARGAGTGFYLCFTPGGATYTLSLDGSKVDPSAVNTALGTACGDLEAEAMYASSGLQYGTHNATIAVSASPSSEFRYFGGGIELGVNTQGYVGVQ